MADAGIAPEWRICKGFPAYEVSDGALIRNIKTGKMIRQKNGRVGFWASNKAHSPRVHLLVAEAFIGSRPTPQHRIRHLNGDKNDCRAVNLFWDAPREAIINRLAGTCAPFSRGAIRQAHHIVAAAIRDGALRRSPCVVCGNEKADAHHDDYAKPLEVTWLCRSHHLQHHRSVGNLLNKTPASG